MQFPRIFVHFKEVTKIISIIHESHVFVHNQFSYKFILRLFCFFLILCFYVTIKFRDLTHFNSFFNQPFSFYRNRMSPKPPITSLDIFPASRLKLSASPFAVLLLLAYSPIGLFLVIFRLSLVIGLTFASLFWNNTLGRCALTLFIQKWYLLIMGIVVKVDEKIPKKPESGSYIYLANMRSYADYLIFNVYLDNAIIPDQPDGLSQFLKMVFDFKTSSEYPNKKYQNAVYFPEETPSSGESLLKWAEPGTSTDSKFLQDEHLEIYPIVNEVTTLLPVELSTVYSTVFWDICTIFFLPLTVYKLKSGDPACIKLRESETTSQLVSRVRMSMSNVLGVPTCYQSWFDKKDLIKRYELDEQQAEIMPASQHVGRAERAAAQARNPPAPVNSGTGVVNSVDKFSQAELDSLVQMFEESFKPDFVKSNYTAQKFDFEATMKSLLAEVAKRENEKVSVESDSNPESIELNKSPVKPEYLNKNPIQSHMTLQERRQALFNFAKANYIHKHGSL